MLKPGDLVRVMRDRSIMTLDITHKIKNNDIVLVVHTDNVLVQVFHPECGLKIMASSELTLLQRAEDV
jgi:hypothetical protein